MNKLTRLGLLAAGAWLILGRKGDVSSSVSITSGKDFFLLAQGDPRWGTMTVGTSTRTMADVGCFFTTLVAARNMLRGESMLPPEAMNILKPKGGFSGAALFLPAAAQLLGVSAPESERIRADVKASIPTLKSKIDDILRRNGLAIINVGYNDRTPRHFVLCNRKSAAGYECMDVAGPTAKLLTLDASTLSGQRTATKRYIGVAVAGVFRS